MRVAIIDDDREFCEAIASLLHDAGFTLVSSCHSAEQALKELPADNPDVILLDIQLPGMSGVECVRHLRSMLPKAEVLILTVFDDSARIFDCLKSGAGGYLLKRAERAEIVEAIRQVHAGGAPMSSSVARKVVEHFRRSPVIDKVLSQLTKREQTVLVKLSEGLSYDETGYALGISLNTVRKHIRSIYEKLRVNSRAEAVNLLLRR